MRDLLQIPAAIFEQMLTHLHVTLPEEGCGFLAGANRLVSRYYPIENHHHSPTRYEMNPKEQIMAFIDAEDRGELIQAVYHSHPNGPEWPSETDIREATYPELVYLICAFKVVENPTVRGFLIQDGQVTEVAIEVV